MEQQYQVIDLATGGSLGRFDTLEEAEGCALYGPRAWQIWQGDVLVDQSDPDAHHMIDRLGRLASLTRQMNVAIALGRFLHCARTRS